MLRRAHHAGGRARSLGLAPSRARWRSGCAPIAPLAWVLERFRSDRTVRDRDHRLHLHVLLHSEHAGANSSPALIGGVTAGIVWALVGKAFTAFIVYSSQMMAVYTGFAIVLTTLIWVNLSWLILLIGAQLAFYVQFPQYLRYGRAAARARPAALGNRSALSVMYLIGRDYRAGKTHWTAGRLAAELDMPGAALAPVLGCLEDSGSSWRPKRSGSCRAAIRRRSSSPR